MTVTIKRGNGALVQIHDPLHLHGVEFSIPFGSLADLRDAMNAAIDAELGTAPPPAPAEIHG